MKLAELRDIRRQLTLICQENDLKPEVSSEYKVGAVLKFWYLSQGYDLIKL